MAKQRRGRGEALSTWSLLNDFLRAATEEECRDLMAEERKGPARVTFLLRIHARLNKERAERERRELLGGKG